MYVIYYYYYYNNVRLISLANVELSQDDIHKHFTYKGISLLEIEIKSNRAGSSQGTIAETCCINEANNPFPTDVQSPRSTGSKESPRHIASEPLTELFL